MEDELCNPHTLFKSELFSLQKNLREEITRYWNDTDLDVSTIDLSRMQYMEMVVQESLRLYPVFPLISRGLKTDLHLG